MKKFVIANFKMHGSLSFFHEYLNVLNRTEILNKNKVELILCPPSLYISSVIDQLKQVNVSVALQSVRMEEYGAFTGALSAKMAKDINCNYVVVGHSEDRIAHNLSTKDIIETTVSVANQSLGIILCCGTTDESNSSIEIMLEELILVKNTLSKFSNVNLIVAFEPLFAIGTGKVPSIDYITFVVDKICQIFKDSNTDTIHNLNHEAQQNICLTSILYGGSVNSINIEEIANIQNIAGVMLGGSSLKVNEVLQIANYFINNES